MDKTIINSKTFQLVVRIFGLFTAALLIFTTSLKIANFVQNDFYANLPDERIGYISSISVNILVIIIGIIIAIKPAAYFLIGFASFIYSVLIASTSPLYYMNIPMLFLTIGILLCSDFYKKHKSIVIGTICGISLYEILIPLRFDVATFTESLIQKIGFSFTIAVAIFFFVQFKKNGKEE